MKKCDVKKLWVHVPKVLFALGGLLIVYLIIYGNELRQINYRLDDVKKIYYDFMNANSRNSPSAGSENSDEPASVQTLAVDWVSVYRDTPYQGPDVYTDYAIKQRNLRALEHIKPLKPEFGMVINDVTDLTYLHESKTKCSLDSGKPTLFVAIVSATGNTERRNAIRETWLKQLMQTEWSHFSVAGAAFVLGEPEQHYEQTVISTEAQDHGDIIQMNVPDQFSNLSKKVAGLFNWMHNNCHEVDYFFKVDDDVYVNVFNIDKLLAIDKPSEPTMFGTLIGNPPSREGKWAVSYEEWPWNEYPRYITTAAVLLTGNSVTPLLAAFQTTPFMRFDDIYVAGICKVKANIRTVTTIRMNARGAPEATDPCMIHNTITWVTGPAERLITWHSYTADYYAKVTECVADESSAGVDPSSAVDFLLIY